MINIYLDQADATIIQKELEQIGVQNAQFVDLPENAHLQISEKGITILPDFNMDRIPLVYSINLPFTSTNFQLCFHLVTETYDRIFSFDIPKNTLFDVNFQVISTILRNESVPDIMYNYYTPESQFEEYAVAHNKAVLLHYNTSLQSLDKEEIHECFRHAEYLAPDHFWLVYTQYLHLIFSLENQEIDLAFDLANRNYRRAQSAELRLLGFMTIYKVLLTINDESQYLEQIKDIEQFFDSQELPDHFYIEYLQAKSLVYESKNDLDEAEKLLILGIEKLQAEKSVLKANLHLLLADLQLKMAQFGDASKYLVSQKSYQEALKVFTKDKYSQSYGHCQMNLGIIYAEMPGLDIKKNVYAGLAQTAFSEAFSIFNKFDEPYQYASVCTNFANAMIRLLPEIDKDRFEKISFYLFEALNIRTAEHFPEERAVSILALLNLYFYRIESAEDIDPIWLQEMTGMCDEINRLTSNEFLLQMAKDASEFIENTQKEI